MADPTVLFNAFILGIIEGLTEFLPVSSTGHLILAGQLLGFNDDKGKVFEIAIQFAAILAVVWEYRARLGHAVVSLRSEPASRRLATNLIVAFLPAAVLGFLFIKQIKFYLFNPIVVASALIVGGVLILWAERRKHVVRAESVDDMTWRDALKVGFAQALAMIPGTSRSGATIIGGLFFGLSRKTAAEFSFFLAIPTMFAATLYDVYKNWQLFSANDIGMFAVGGAASFVSALLAVRGLIRFISRHDFTVFAWYRIVFGILVLVTAYTGWVDWGTGH
jgi:undecaprenyl-diphosphatase